MLTYSILKTLDLSSPDELIGYVFKILKIAVILSLMLSGHYFTININIRWTYADPSWARIAALVPVIVACAEAGDEVADNILLDSVEELASSVKAVIQRLGLAGEGMKSNSIHY